MGPLSVRTNIAKTETFDITEVVGFGTPKYVGYWDGGAYDGPTFELQKLLLLHYQLIKVI